MSLEIVRAQAFGLTSVLVCCQKDGNVRIFLIVFEEKILIPIPLWPDTAMTYWPTTDISLPVYFETHIHARYLSLVFSPKPDHLLPSVPLTLLEHEQKHTPLLIA